ncbi:MAG: alpha/beta hydrolase [Alphaproteobacteria bacterium]|nr:alpha/beta hydrolase [Alphaproteobacteria bacterium]
MSKLIYTVSLLALLTASAGAQELIVEPVDDDIIADQTVSVMEAAQAALEQAAADLSDNLIGETLPDNDIQPYPSSKVTTRYFGQKDSDIVSDIPYGKNDEAGKTVQADDAKIYYEVYGSGDPVLVLHGGGVGSSYEMGRFIDELSKDYQVIVPSTRGHGKSEIGTAKITYEQKANDMLAVLNDTTEQPVIVLGFSDGAYTAYKLAAMYPQRIKKIIAIGAGEITPQTRIFPTPKVDDVIASDEAFMRGQIDIMPQVEKLQDYWDDYYNFYNHLTVSKETLSEVKCPVLLISGEKDTNAPLDTIIAAYRMLPKAEIAIIADAPHQVFLTNFAAVWDNIKPFLQK